MLQLHADESQIGLRCDCEPSTLLEAVKKTCRNLGIITHSEPTPVGDHQAIYGGAEVTVKIIRAQANVLVSAIEKECCEGRDFWMQPPGICVGSVACLLDSQPVFNNTWIDTVRTLFRTNVQGKAGTMVHVRSVPEDGTQGQI